MSVETILVQHLADTQFSSIDKATIHSATERVIDVFGCALAGRAAPGCDMLAGLLHDWGGKPESTVFGYGYKLPAQQAALVNSIMTRSYDYEPVGVFMDGKSIPAHISGTTVPAALAVAERQDSAGKDFLTALILGDDLSARLSAASEFDLDGGWDNTGTVNTFGAAAIAGKLLGLDPNQMLNAFGIALNQVGGTLQNIFGAAHSFKLPQGLAARAGLFSAFLAQRGFTGPKDALSGKHGYFARYCKSFNEEVFTKDLGKTFYADETFKIYPCCRANHAAIDCTLRITKEHGIKWKDVREIVVGVRPTSKDFAVGQPFSIGEIPQISAAFSLQYAVATALLRGSVELEHFSDDYIKDPNISALVEKVRIEASIPQEKTLASSVRIRTTNGEEYSAQVENPTGSDNLSPLSASEKERKFKKCVRFSEAFSEAWADTTLHALSHVADALSMRGLLDALLHAPAY